MQTATFGAGCFWGVQDDFDKLKGVIDTTAGYMGGSTPRPTYEQVCAGGTGHLEVVLVKYLESRVRYERLLEVFWSQVAKITLLALDYHTGQYRPAIFHYTDRQRRLAMDSRQQRAGLGLGKQPLGAKLTDIKAASEFWPEPDQAHQHYFQKNPRQNQCH